MRSRSRSRSASSGYSTSPSRSPSRQQRRGRSRSPALSLPGRGPSRSPSAAVPATRMVRVDKLTKNVTVAHIKEIFGAYGAVLKVDMPLHSVTGLCRSCAVVDYETEEQARAAIRHMDKGQIDGNVIHVSLSRGERAVSPRPYFRAGPPPRPRRSPYHANRRAYSPPPRRPYSPPPRRGYSPPRRPSYQAYSPAPRRPSYRSRSPPPARQYHPQDNYNHGSRRSPLRTPRRPRSISRTPPRRYDARSPPPPTRRY